MGLNESIGNSMVVWWLGIHAATAKGMDLIPGLGTKIPQAKQLGYKKKKERKKAPQLYTITIPEIVLRAS